MAFAIICHTCIIANYYLFISINNTDNRARRNPRQRAPGATLAAPQAIRKPAASRLHRVRTDPSAPLATY
jgi:hypothetical protein